MFVTITTVDDKLFTLEVSADIKISEFKEICSKEVNMPVDKFIITFNGTALANEVSLKDSGVNDYDVLIVEPFVVPAPAPILDFSSIQIPSSLRQTTSTIGPNGDPPSSERSNADFELLITALRSSPDRLAVLRQNNPRLADAFLSGDMSQFRAVFEEQIKLKEEQERHRRLLLHSDPFNEEAQRMIETEIRNNIVVENREAAMEYHPEAFGTVVMLYINCQVNGRPVKAFVDSGAQMTIISNQCAERCGIKHLMDPGWAGTARGIGVQAILGRIHMVQLQIENVFLPCSFSVLPDQPIDMLLGLDMLKRHQCCIDLKNNLLRIGTTETETRFLNEGELPADARLTGSDVTELEDRELASTLQRSAEEAEKNLPGPSDK